MTIDANAAAGPTNDGSVGSMTRRDLLLATGGAIALAVLPRPAGATAEAMAGAIRRFTRGAPVTPGRITLDVPQLIENGNSVPVTVTVDSPMQPQDFVRAIALFNEKNPQPDIAIFHLTAFSGRAQIATRIRLGDTQPLTAIAEMSDGSFWSASAEVVVTLPACVEE